MTNVPTPPASAHVRVMELARGGMGSVEVVLRKGGGFSRLLVRKRLLPAHRGDPAFRAMFLDEARIAGLIRHPNVVSVIDVGEDGEGPYLVMDLIEGIPLSHVVTSVRRRLGLLPIQLCVRVCADVARGLHAAHELCAHDGTPLGLVHRDVTPQNILLSYEGEVRVADFGIAKALGRASRTSTGILKGKIGYMSPEQLRFREPDRRSDLFSLGVVLFEMLSSRRLYGGGNAGGGLECARRILDEPPPDIAEHRDEVPPSLVELLFDLLAKDPDDRPATAQDVAARLDAVLAELLLEEEPLAVKDYLQEHFADARREAREALERAVRSAEHEADRPAEPARRGGWVGMAAMIVLVVLAGIGGFLLLPASDGDGGSVPARSAGARDPAPDSIETAPAAPPERPAPDPLVPALEADSVAAAPPARTSRARRRSPAADPGAAPSIPAERPAAERGSREVPRWSWE